MVCGTVRHLGAAAIKHADIADPLNDFARGLLGEVIERRIYLIRGQKVMLDSDLAELYEVETRRLNEQVRRNKERFPEDFCFQLTQVDLFFNAN